MMFTLEEHTSQVFPLAGVNMSVPGVGNSSKFARWEKKMMGQTKIKPTSPEFFSQVLYLLKISGASNQTSLIIA